MRRPFALLVLICVACGPQRHFEPCSPSATGVIDPPILVALVGQPVEVELLLPPAVMCPQGNPVATGVTTEVLDALNQPVPHAHSAPTSSNTSGYSTRVSFTPTAAGVHYLTARYEPALGITQRQLQVALERSAEAPWLRTTLGPICDEVLPLREAVMCRRGMQLSVIRDGGVVSTEPITVVSSAGDVGWLLTDTQLSRLEDVDGGIVRANFPLSAGRGAVAVTPDRWVLGAGADFVDVRFVDGGLSERRWSVEPRFARISGPGLGLAEEIVGWATPSRLCAGAPDASVRCVDSPLQPLQGEGSSIWLRGADSGLVAIARIKPSAAEPVVLFVPAQSSVLIDARQSRPVFTWNGRLVALRADDLSFEAWRAPGLVARQAVTESFVIFQLQSGQTVIFKR